MIIIPDVHGRVFWKEALARREKDEEVIFLGDYVDPYSYEGITSEDAIKNLEEILGVRDEKMIMLLGNHDFMYLCSDHPKCRHDYQNEKRISDLLDNKDIFQVAYKKELLGKTYVFSHAGFNPGWVDYAFEGLELPEVVDKANELYQKWDSGFLKNLGTVSYLRGGYSEFGSMIWSDTREYRDFEDESLYQIYGHTQLRDEPVITSKFACLDCRRGFRLDEKTGKLCSLSA